MIGNGWRPQIDMLAHKFETLIIDNRGIGEQLGISPRTVEVHKSRVMTKLGARNLAELVRIAQASQQGRA